MKIAVYAFSTSGFFFQRWIDTYKEAAEWFVLLPRGHFRYLFKNLESAGRVGYLYEEFNEKYKKTKPTDSVSILSSRMTYYQALLRDKGGYRFLSQAEQLRRAAVISSIYKAYLEKWRPDVVVFPDLESVDGFILWGLCDQLKIRTACFAGMRFLGRGFFSEFPNEQLPTYFGQFDAGNLQEAERCLALARENKWSEFTVPPSAAVAPPPLPGLWKRLSRSTSLRLGQESRHAGEDTVLLGIKRAGLRWLQPFRQFVFDRFQSKHFDIHPGSPALPKHFVYYPLHVSPESSINGLSPYFVDQTRALDRLILALPANYSLLVKEHPAMMGARESGFYQMLRRKPGVLLVHPKVSSLDLIRNASLVATVTGTVGLECYFLDKPCVMFGENFFKHLCLSWRDEGSTSSHILKLIDTYRAPSSEEKKREIAKFLNVGELFLLTDPLIAPAVLSPANLSASWIALHRHLERGSMPPC